MPDLTLDTTAPVLVTGATGYVAGWIVKALLDAGATVHAPIRNPDDRSKTAPLQALADQSPGQIRFFKADLLEDGSYAEAMAGCTLVFHTASPFKLNVKDPQAELIDPALGGTRNILAEATRAGTVKRVVLTSSCVAIYTDAADCADMPGGQLSEEVWNSTASLDYQPYAYSKTLAEQEAWRMAKAQDQWDLVTINPSFVLGPALHGKPTSESFTILRQMGDGSTRTGVPNFGVGVVDVRDLARAHLAAATLPQAEGRHIISGHNTNFLEMARTLLPTYGTRYPIPKRPVPKWLFWLISPLFGAPRRTAARNVNIPFRADNSKSVTALGQTYRPLSETMNDMFDYMINAGILPRK